MDFALLQEENRAVTDSGGLRGLCSLAFTSPFRDLAFPQGDTGFFVFSSLFPAPVSGPAPCIVDLGYEDSWRRGTASKWLGH